MSATFQTVDPYIKRQELAGLSGQPVAITNKASGGSVGSAATTVDIASQLNVNQTTASQTLTLPDPTNTSADTQISVNNVGSVSFVILSTTISPGAGIIAAWTGSAWSAIGTSSGASNVTVAGGKTFTVSNTLTLAGTDSTTMTFPSTSATVARTDAANTFTGNQTFSGHLIVEGVTSSGATGTGSFVFATSPTLTTPTLGVATATTYNKITLTAPASGATITITDGKTLAVTGTLTFSGTDSTVMTFPSTSQTIVGLTSSQTLTNKTLTSPTMTAPVLGVATATSLNGLTVTTTTGTLTVTGSKVLTISNTLTLAGTDSTTITFPSTSCTVARTDAANTFTGVQTMTSPVLTTPAIGVATGTSFTATGTIVSTGTAGIGYGTGAGGTVSQGTNKSTGVTLNKTCGAITMMNSTLNTVTAVSFVLTNSTIAAGDVLIVNHATAGTTGSYLVGCSAVGSGSATITVYNCSAGNLGEAIVLNFVVVKGVQA